VTLDCRCWTERRASQSYRANLWLWCVLAAFLWSCAAFNGCIGVGLFCWCYNIKLLCSSRVSRLSLLDESVILIVRRVQRQHFWPL